MIQAGLLKDKSLPDSYHYFFVAFLLSERQKKKENEGSPYQPYLDSLPTDCNDFPPYYTEEELALLQGSNILNRIHEAKSKNLHAYEYICSKVPDMKKHDFNDF